MTVSQGWPVVVTHRCVGNPHQVGTAELHTALADPEVQLAAGKPEQVRLNADGELIIPPLTAEEVPTAPEALRDEPSGVLP